MKNLNHFDEKSQSFWPSQVGRYMLVPIIKSKSGRLMSKDNYRPIALASIVSKVLEKFY